METLENCREWEKRIGQAGAEILPYLLLTGLTFLLLYLPVEQGAIFGSEGDWYSQHVGAAEALRQTMLSAGGIFPQFVGLGGGINAYDLAYYGLLRPDVLLSCLLPNVEMKEIISVYAAVGAVASVNITYLWLKGKNFTVRLAATGAILMAAATCFFHAHHQIMFINYMPFLVLALLGIDRILAGKNGLLLTIALFFICIHSFYYAPTCMVVCFLYYLHQLVNSGNTTKEALKMTGKTAFAVTLAICLAAVLLIPTGLAILSTEKDAGSFAQESIETINLSFSGLLYQPYSCGMTLISLYLLLLSLWDKKKRWLTAVVLLILMVPAVWYVLSGFLYAREKILIPLVPLIVWICTDTLARILEGKQKALMLPALLCAVPIVLRKEDAWALLILIDGLVVLAWVLVQRMGKIPQRTKHVLTACLLLLPLCANFGVNKELEHWLQKDDMRQSWFSFGDITMFASEPLYRFDYLSNNYVNSNVLPDGSLNKTAMYSSVTSSTYGKFYYDTMGNPISIRNRVVLMPNQNSLFNYFMGIRYVLTGEQQVPYGYEPIFRRNGYVLAENPDVLPMCYGTDKVLLQEKAERGGISEFPKTLAQLCGVSAEAQNPEELFEEAFPTVYDESVQGKQTVHLKETLKGKALVISLHIDRKDDRQVLININGMANNLSSWYAPYPNENYDFTYVLSDSAGLSELEIAMSRSRYNIEDIKVYTLDIPTAEAQDIAVPTLAEDFQANGSDIFQGIVTMKQDGYFVTSYPYKKGFQILVDGKAQKAEKVNTAFVGFPLEKGKHSIQISYKAPGFAAGAALSAAAMAMLLLSQIIVFLRKRKREK
ncbi:YfhO family protein [Senimuribacter intestinalis]|uniref:YfhO family protein n=1 Tax=Senimuribacter intestinalis TaxID=2941507 RepID=UPI00203BF85C|nr:YfhO family protein [Senimuribacter intestinalis]